MTRSFTLPSNFPGWGQYGGSPFYLDPKAPLYRGSNPISQYGEDGVSKNPDFYVEGGLCDYMNGKENTQIIISHVNPQLECVGVDWKTKEAISGTDSTYGNFPAAMACYRYYTKGTTQGDWYLPAMGEISFIVTRAKEISDGLVVSGIEKTESSLSSRIANEASYTYSGDFYTSTEYEKDISPEYYRVCKLLMSSGILMSTYKTDLSNLIIAFIKI